MNRLPKWLRYGLYVCFMLMSTQAVAQQQAMFTQYMFNGLAINPAYAGSQEAIYATLLSRKQWVGVDGAPSTQTFFIHAPVNDTRVGLGLTFMHDKIGVSNQSSFYAAYAYRIPVGAGKLSFGIQGGFSTYTENLSSINPTDPTFAEGGLNAVIPSFSAGLYYYTRRFYAGLSVPQLNNHEIDQSTGQNTKMVRHYFLTSGMVFDLSESVKMKPSFLVKMVPGAPVEIDLNANFLLMETFWVGASWRSLESLDLITQVIIGKRLHVGYAYDLALGADISRLGKGSHELMLSYRFRHKKTQFDTPRYF